MLDGCRVELLADPCLQGVTLAAIVAEHADLDELVRGERDVDLVQDGGRQPVLADAHDGTQVMRGGATGPALGGC